MLENTFSTQGLLLRDIMKLCICELIHLWIGAFVNSYIYELVILWICPSLNLFLCEFEHLWNCEFLHLWILAFVTLCIWEFMHFGICAFQSLRIFELMHLWIRDSVAMRVWSTEALYQQGCAKGDEGSGGSWPVGLLGRKFLTKKTMLFFHLSGNYLFMEHSQAVLLFVSFQD